MAHHAGCHRGEAPREQLSQSGRGPRKREDPWASTFTGGQGGVRSRSHEGFYWCV